MRCLQIWALAFGLGACLTALGQTPPILDASYGSLLPGPAGSAVWWCEATYKVGRQRATPTRTNDAVEISAARNEYEPFQIVLRPEATWSNLTVSVSDLVLAGGGFAIGATNVEACLVEYVPVTMLSDYTCATGPHPDPLLPIRGFFDVAGGSNQPVWFTVHVPKDAPAGIYQGSVMFQGGVSFSVPVRLRVFNFSLADTTHTQTAYYVDVSWPRHRYENVAQQRQVWDLYLENLRKHRVSPYSPHLYAPIVWSLVDGEFKVDFKDFDAAMVRYLDEFGFNTFNLFGHKSPSFPSTLDGYEAFTPEWQQRFAKLMRPILSHLREKGWMNKAYCYWLDEPREDTFLQLFQGMDALSEHAPGLRRLLSFDNFPPSQYDPQLNDRVDIWVPMLPLATNNRFVQRAAAGEERWWYVCLGPTAPWPNNYVDHPAINHRIRFWMAEKFEITGDMYWSMNYWVGRNPWTNAWVWANNGDGTLIYPPTKEFPTAPVLTGPVDSLRWEILREALEDGEYFWLLRYQLTNALLRLGPSHPSVTEGFAARDAALSMVTNLTQYSEDTQRLYESRARIAAAIEQLNTGMPFFVQSPQARGGELGETLILRAEALGWPPPAFQWRCGGTNVPGATDAVLVLSSFGPAQAGDYWLVASNSVGAATSVVARVDGLWPGPPRLLTQPEPVVRPAGERSVFSVTAVGTQPLNYQWLVDGMPVVDRPATNAALVLTNLALSQAGEYSVIVSNLAGVVTSAVARLTVLVASQAFALVSTGAVWRYHDLGEDLGAAWPGAAWDDSAWAAGNAPLGFGNGDERTLIGSNPGNGPGPATYYFRHAFAFGEAALRFPLAGRLQCDDGAVVFLNGAEVFRTNLPAGPVLSGTAASATVEGVAESQFHSFSLPAELLRPGDNILAVEVHQSGSELPADWQTVAKWTLNEPASPWLDGVGTNSFFATGTNLIAWAGRFGGCISNAGSATDYLLAADSPDLNYSGPFTAGGWFAFGVGTVGQAIGLQKEGEFSLYYTGTTTNRYRFEVNGAFVQDQTCCTAYGQWRFVVGWFDGSNISIQVDNGPIYSASASALTPTPNPLTALKLLSGGGGIAADELFFCRGVLPAAERAARYQNRVETRVADLRFDFALAATGGQLPQVLAVPADLARWVGESAAFTVSAVSATPLAYQWRFEGTPLAGATSSLLFLDGVTPERAGQYSVAISNNAGMIFTAPANLNVMCPPGLRVIVAAHGSESTLEVPGFDMPVVVMVSTNLVDWTELVRLPAAAGATNLIDVGASASRSRFYRLRSGL